MPKANFITIQLQGRAKLKQRCVTFRHIQVKNFQHVLAKVDLLSGLNLSKGDKKETRILILGKA